MIGSEADRAAGWRRLLIPGLLTLIALALLVSLGVWQLQRLAWKETLIARIEARTHTAPVPAPAPALWASWRAEEDEYRPLRVEGRFLYSAQAFVHANAVLDKAGARMGYFVLTPLQQDDGSIIVINRGFIPIELKNDAAAFATWREVDEAHDRAVVAGLARAPQLHGWFVPPDRPAEGAWFTRDPVAIAQAAGLANVAPFYIDAFANKRESWPRGGLTVVSFPNNHLDYAFTWFGLAVALAVIFVMFAHHRLRERRG